jgi:hypothetical protein
MPDGILVDESLCSVQIVGEVDGVRADQQPIDPARDRRQRRVNSIGLRRLGPDDRLGCRYPEDAAEYDETQDDGLPAEVV